MDFRILRKTVIPHTQRQLAYVARSAVHGAVVWRTGQLGAQASLAHRLVWRTG
ncbi:hypothetical protein Pla52o_46290 [Novipirellula galeiformis]|uniref:Uncharacterized protein n=1 Tax=Novipirellula galeiformis TaxID=2528004 RepID=A0A5C6C7P2_9BACT|nr:hypothetical protein Pla52o_46290 [Novipirellula galeiformis]